MFRSRALLSGHGDLFPTTKAAAHLTPRWILSREVPHAPGTGKCYASFTHPQHQGRFQFVTPEMHETKVVSMESATAGMPHLTTQRPSAAAARAAIAGVTAGMNHHHKKTNDTPLARANIAAKEAAEQLARTRDFYSRPAPTPVKRGYEIKADYRESERHMELRTLNYIKIDDNNKSGFTKEWYPHERNPPAKPAPPAPKK